MLLAIVGVGIPVFRVGGWCLPSLAGHLDEEVATSVMAEELCSGSVLPVGRSRRSFCGEFEADAVALVLDEGRTVASVARWLGIGATSLGNWVRRARVGRGEREGLVSGERAELTRLGRENARLRMGA